MSKPFQKTDIRVTRFRLPNEDLRDSGSGCLVYHIPTQKSYVVEKEQPFYVNKGEAISQLCTALGVTMEALQQQADTKVFPNWETTQLHTRRYGKHTITTYFLHGEEDPEMTGWTWGVDDDRLDNDADAGLYETPEGAIKAAEMGIPDVHRRTLWGRRRPGGRELSGYRIPELTPEVIEQLVQESREIREEHHKILKKMWDIPLHERLAVSR